MTTLSTVICILFSLYPSIIDAIRPSRVIRQAHAIHMGIVMAPPPPSPLPESIVPKRVMPVVSQSPTLTYTRSSMNKTFAGRDDRPLTDASARKEETTMNHIYKYNAITAEIQQWNQLSYRTININHPELTHSLCPSLITPGNLLAGDLMSDWTDHV